MVSIFFVLLRVKLKLLVISFAPNSEDSVSTALPDVITILLLPNSSFKVVSSIGFEKRIRI